MDVKENLTPAEWKLMECLWAKAPRSGREAADELHDSAGWSRSTTLNMLRRMSGKGAVICGEENGMKVYSPAIARDDAVARETDSFLGRVYRGSLSLMLNTMTRQRELSREEINELYDILRKAGEDEA